MEDYYGPRPRSRKKIRPILLIMGVAVLSVTGLLVATCGDSIVQAP